MEDLECNLAGIKRKQEAESTQTTFIVPIFDEVVEEGSKLLLSTKVYDLRLQRQFTEKALKNLEEHARKKRKNGIIDLSNTTKGFQVNILGNKILVQLAKSLSYKQDFDEDWLKEVLKFTDLTKNLRNPTSTSKVYDNALSMKTNTDDMERQILKQHTMARHMLTEKYVDICSKMSILVKYWAPIFESYFCYHDDLFLQWGDTVSLDCKAADLDLRLDLRVVLKFEQDIEAMTGEVASRQATTTKKFMLIE
ncbi:hypothetical protein [Absidia glauca]|uniref:Uncharacterized protein n=1 Tax=Absidia glauca TaxID=4829 RepID=A0A168PPS4_ABSGL|nr:hypothetical protein [Absidia glauca]